MLVDNGSAFFGAIIKLYVGQVESHGKTVHALKAFTTIYDCHFHRENIGFPVEEIG